MVLSWNSLRIFAGSSWKAPEQGGTTQKKASKTHYIASLATLVIAFGKDDFFSPLGFAEGRKK